jgi:hypothetical protein
MSSKALKPSARSLYDRDFFAWTSETARLLRAGRFAEVDIQQLAEELQDMGKSAKRELWSRLTIILLHLLKWQQQPEKRSRSWRSTVDDQRTEIRRLCGQSPSLRRDLAAAVEDVYPDAVRRAVVETGLPAGTWPRQCPFTEDQILNEEFLPE